MPEVICEARHATFGPLKEVETSLPSCPPPPPPLLSISPSSFLALSSLISSLSSPSQLAPPPPSSHSQQVSGRLVRSNPPIANKELVNEHQVRGNVVYIKRGGCSFTKKARMAQRAGERRGGGSSEVDSTAHGQESEEGGSEEERGMRGAELKGEEEGGD
eukprot:757078-Hanusia_phi.AAC.2